MKKKIIKKNNIIMAWIDTGFRRTLKLQITKTEANPSLSGFPSTGVTYTIDGNTTQFTGETLTPYSWANGLTMGQAPLAEFQARATATKNWVKARFPDEATSGITWANMRVGANMYILVTSDADSVEFKLYPNDTNTGHILTTETICMPFEYTYKEGNDPLVSGTIYYYINKNSNGSTCSTPNGVYASYFTKFTCNDADIINISASSVPCATETTMPYIEIDKQNSFSLTNNFGFE